jgi:hypothetical protein
MVPYKHLRVERIQMYQEDYILRHIRLFVQMIARIFGLIKDGDISFALEVVEGAFRDYLGLSMDDFLAYPQDRLLDFLVFGELGTLGVNKAGFAANLLLQAGIAHRMQNHMERSAPCLEKGLGLVLELELSKQGPFEMPEFAPTVEDFLKESSLASFSPDVLGALAFYFEKSGEYARAESVVRVMLEMDPADPEMRAFARSFYEYLLAETDDTLAKGGARRQQLEAALKGL